MVMGFLTCSVTVPPSVVDSRTDRSNLPEVYGRLIASPASDELVLRGFAAPQPFEVLQQKVDDVVLVAARLAGGVRRYQHVGKAPQRRCGGQRFVPNAVERGA